MNAFIAELATTNLRIAVGLLEALGYVVFCLTAMARGWKLELDGLIIVGSFILLQQGLDVTQFIAKRATYTPEIHEAPPREDVQPPKSPSPAAPAAPTPEAP